MKSRSIAVRLPLVLPLVLLVACGGSEKPADTTPANQPALPPPPPPPELKLDAGPAPASAASAAPAAPPAAKPAVSYAGLSTPESVLYDDKEDLYLVSNINGAPGDADNNGFISKLAPDGTVTSLKWIEGGKNKVTLHAPKGSSIVGDVLYVADIDTLRMFDRKTGAPKGEVKVPGASFLNDVAVAPDGKVLVTDTGVKFTASGPEPTGTDAVYAVSKDKKLTTIAKSTNLGKPNGVAVVGGKTWVVTFGSGELYSLDAKGAKTDVQKLPKGMLDGIASAGGNVLVSSWEGQAVYRGTPGNEFKPALEGLKTPADIGFDSKRNRVLVPRFMDNVVEAFDLK